MNSGLSVWVWKACSRASHLFCLLYLSIGKPWERQSFPNHCGPKCQSIRNTENNQKQFIQFSSVTQLCPTFCNPRDCSMPGLPVCHQLPELAQTHVHRVGNAIQPSLLLLSHYPPAFNLSQHQSLFQRVSSSHQVAKVLEIQLQHQSFQWIFRTDFL